MDPTTMAALAQGAGEVAKGLAGGPSWAQSGFELGPSGQSGDGWTVATGGARADGGTVAGSGLDAAIGAAGGAGSAWVPWVAGAVALALVVSAWRRRP